jgi:hypothetical protein
MEVCKDFVSHSPDDATDSTPTHKSNIYFYIIARSLKSFSLTFSFFYVGRREGERENVEKSIHDVRKKFSCDDKNIGALNFSTIKKHSAMRA